MSLQDKLIEISPLDFLTVYHVNTETSSYTKVFTLDINFLYEKDYGHEYFSNPFWLLEKVKEYLEPGTYFSVFKDSLGYINDWTTEVLEEVEQKKIDKNLSRKRFISDSLSWLRRHGDTIIILMTIITGTLWIKLG